jgi:hypothetical protein
MNLTASPWIVAVILGLVALSPARAGITPEEVKEFEANKIKAEKGDAVAQFNLGGFYADGNGVTKDYAEAHKWWRKAAEQGEPLSSVALAVCYTHGRGVTKDYAEAAKWWRKAAEMGDVGSQGILGSLYILGLGVKKDDIEAYAYLNLAKETNESARKNLLLVEKRLSSDDRILGQQRTKQIKKEIEGRLAAVEALRKSTEKK